MFLTKKDNSKEYRYGFVLKEYVTQNRKKLLPFSSIITTEDTEVMSWVLFLGLFTFYSFSSDSNIFRGVSTSLPQQTF